MNAGNKDHAVTGDKPLTDPSEDKLGYAGFARHLADALCEMLPIEGLVVAIYGAWGTGKTTLLNFIVDYVNKRQDDKRPSILYFNPGR